MASIIYPLIFLFLTSLLIEPTTSAIPTYLQNLELDDITSLWDKFPSIIAQIKQAVNRFRCPKGWRRLGGSCYYLSNITSIPSEANQTCNEIHSNHSNLMQIRNTVELFYAAHVLTKHNLSGLMIEIEPNLLKGKTMTQLLMDDQGRWQRMKDKFREVRVRYYKIKEKVISELNSAGLRISRRSKKIKQTVKKRKQEFIHDHIDPEVDGDYDYYHENMTNSNFNDTVEVDEYEYDNIDSEDENEDFERMEDIRGICDQIDWNVLNNNATVYLLTTLIINDKIVCSLSDIEPDIEYDHVCEYVLDFCFANIVCGKHGHCANTLSGFKCSCSFLYGGLLCERISKQGKQILLAIALVVLLYGLSLKPVRWLLGRLIKNCVHCYKSRLIISRQKKQNKKEQMKGDKEKLVSKKKAEESDEELPTIPDERRQTIAQEFMDFLLPKNHQPLTNPNKRDLIRLCWVGGLSLLYLTLLLSITTVAHFTSFKYDLINETKFDALVNETILLVAKCGSISNYRKGNLIFFPVSLTLIIIFSWSIKREKRCPHLFDGRPGLIAPIEPFRTANRFTTATVFGILAFEVLKIFEELLFSTADPLNQGILVELLLRIAMVILIGLRYYPILASLQLRNVAVRFFACLYIIGDIVYTIIREGSCMGFLPLSTYYTALEEATLRMEIGTWFIVYGLIKNTPHFMLLSYICAELCVRFAYDSVYVPLKKKQSIWSAPMAQPDESAFAKYYVTKLFRRNVRLSQVNYSTKVDVNNMDDFEYEAELQKKANQSRVKQFFDSIYHWDDDFRFTTMTTCTYTVAIIFLYYLACTLVFLYISRTTGHISFIRYYIETTFNIEFRGFFSLRSTIITSAVLTVGLFAFQLYLGMKNYKRHKLQLFKGIYEDVPSAANFNPNSIAAKSVHYSGFLVGYMAWGFVICFHIIFFILSAIHIISLQIRYFELILAITVPVLVIYLLKMVGTSSAGKFLFIQDMDEKLNLKNRKVYAIFVYFNFFADCFLGIASCIIRLIKASVLNLVYMARLDCSFLGRPLEKLDLGFAAYVSYLHMEVTHTNPIMLAFCYSLYDDVVKRRPKQCYDDECCIAAGELDDDDPPIEDKPKTIEKIASKTSSGGTNGSISRTAKVSPRGTPAPVAKKQKSIDGNNGDDDGGLSVEERNPKTKSRSPSIISEKGSQKSKQKKLSIDNNLEEEEKDKAGGYSTQVDSTVSRLIPLEQPRLPPPSAPIPHAPTRRDLPPLAKDDEEDDDGGIQPRSISTVSKVIPKDVPRLLPMQHSSPPPVPRRQDAVIDKDDDEDDDGGMNPNISAKHKQKSDKKKTKKEETKKTKHRDDDDDDNEDDDGGLQPPSISTITKIMPQHAPRLSPPPGPRPQAPGSIPAQRLPPPATSQQAPGSIPTQRPPPPMTFQQAPGSIPTQRLPSSMTFQQVPPGLAPAQRQPPPVAFQQAQRQPPPVAFQQAPRAMPMQGSVPPPAPKRQDLPVDDDEDDGGINPKTIAKRKQELEKKKKEKEEMKKKKQLDDDDEDGGISKPIVYDKKKSKDKNKSKVPLILDDDEDDDGGVSKEKRLAAEKKKKELEDKKKKQEQIKAKLKHDEDEDDDGAVKRQESPQKKKPPKKLSKSEILKEEDEDDDGGRVVKNYDTIKKMMPTKQPTLGHQTKKTPSPEVLDDGSMLTSRPPQEPLLKSYDTVGRIVPKISTDYQKTEEGNHYDTIPTDDDGVARAQPTKSSPSRDIPYLRTISYREATENASPLDERRTPGTSSRSRSNTNDDSSHHSASSGVINRSYSNTGSIQSASNHSIKQQSKQSSQQASKEPEQQTEESTVESEDEDDGEEEEEEEEEEEDEEEEEEEEEEKKKEEKPKDKPSKLQLKPIPNVSTAYSFISHLVKPEAANELQKIRKQRQARFRWYLAYTIINNYHLFDLRKQAQSRLARLRIERSNLIDEQQHAVAAAAAQQLVEETAVPGSPEMRMRTLKVATPAAVPVLPGQQPPAPRKLLSVPVSVMDDFPQSPAERYVAIRSSMLYDATAQQADTPRSPVVSQVPSTVSQPMRIQAKSSVSPRSLGFQTKPIVVVHPPSDTTTSTSKGKRPPYQRQETEVSDPLMIRQSTATPIFQALPESTHSTADYPFANGSSATNRSTLRTQMSHAQHMQAWRQNQVKKLHKHHPHCYHYGSSLQRPLEEKIASAAILTPQIIPEEKNLRLPSSSPFAFVRHEKTINEKTKTTREKPTSSSSNTDENKQDKSIKKKSLRTTSSLMKRKDSQNSSNVTEV